LGGKAHTHWRSRPRALGAANLLYSLRPRADRDLDDYADYLAAEAGLEIALRFFSAAQETFLLLAAQPNMGWRSRLKHEALKSMRVFRVGGFERMLIFYRPESSGIEILRVVHGSRNLQALFRRRAEID
jgi:toxin ParE1/3/4